MVTMVCSRLSGSPLPIAAPEKPPIDCTVRPFTCGQRSNFGLGNPHASRQPSRNAVRPRARTSQVREAHCARAGLSATLPTGVNECRAISSIQLPNIVLVEAASLRNAEQTIVPQMLPLTFSQDLPTLTIYRFRLCMVGPCYVDFRKLIKC